MEELALFVSGLKEVKQKENAVRYSFTSIVRTGKMKSACCCVFNISKHGIKQHHTLAEMRYLSINSRILAI